MALETFRLYWMPGILTVPAAMALAPAPIYNDWRLHLDDAAAGLLQRAGVIVVVHAQVQVRQDLRGRQLAHGRGFDHPLPGNQQIGVLHAGQCQGTLGKSIDAISPDRMGGLVV